MRSLILAAFVVTAVLMMTTSVQGAASEDDTTARGEKQEYRRRYRKGDQRSDLAGRVNSFVLDTSAAIQSVLEYTGLAGALHKQNAMDQAHGEMWKGFDALVAADRRGRNPAAHSQGFDVTKEGRVSGFGGGLGGLNEHTNPEDAKNALLMKRESERVGAPKDPLDAATRNFADALHRYVTQEETPGDRHAREQRERENDLSTSGTDKYAAEVAKRELLKKIPAEHRLIHRLVEDSNQQHARAMATQNTGVTNFLYGTIPPSFCTMGAVAVPNTTIFLCEDPTTKVKANWTAAQFNTLPVEHQARCSMDAGTTLECVCPADYIQGTPAFGEKNCYLKRIYCQSEITSPRVTCPTIPIDENFRDPKCFTLARGTRSLTVQSNTTCKFLYTAPRFYEAFGVEVSLFTDEYKAMEMVTLPSNDYTNTKQNLAQSALASFEDLPNLAFSNYVVNTVVNGEQFALSNNNTLSQEGQFFSQMYNFRRISDKTMLLTASANSSSPATSLTGRSTVSFTFDLTNFNNDFLAGGRLYIESGFTGYSDSAAGGGATAGSLTVDIDGFVPPEPANKLDEGLVTALIVIGVIVGLALLVILALTVRWWKQKQQQSLDSEDEDE